MYATPGIVVVPKIQTRYSILVKIKCSLKTTLTIFLAQQHKLQPPIYLATNLLLLLITYFKIPIITKITQ